MPRLTDLAKQKKPRVKKSSKEDPKRKTPPAEDEAFVPEPAAPKSNNLTIREPTAQAPRLPHPVEGKGKEKVDEPPRPLKRLRRASNLTLPASPAEVAETAPQTGAQRIANPQPRAVLNTDAGDIGFSMFNEYAKWLGQCASSVASETWKHLLADNSHSLLSLGLMSSFIVSKL